MVNFSKNSIDELVVYLDLIINSLDCDATKNLDTCKKKLKKLPPFFNFTDIDKILDLLIDTTYELSKILKHKRANAILKKNAENIYYALNLIGTIETELFGYEQLFKVA